MDNDAPRPDGGFWTGVTTGVILGITFYGLVAMAWFGLPLPLIGK